MRLACTKQWSAIKSVKTYLIASTSRDKSQVKTRLELKEGETIERGCFFGHIHHPVSMQMVLLGMRVTRTALLVNLCRRRLHKFNCSTLPFALVFLHPIESSSDNEPSAASHANRTDNNHVSIYSPSSSTFSSAPPPVTFNYPLLICCPILHSSLYYLCTYLWMCLECRKNRIDLIL